jgi:hypothetical protein
VESFGQRLTEAATAHALTRPPDFVEPFVAWRVWRVVERDGELSLASVVKRTVWPAGQPLVAECLKSRPFLDVRRRPPHGAPTERCECGIYAATLERAEEYLNDSYPEALARVLGRVALWGSVVQCERGFRASHAYPLALYVSTRATRNPRRTPDEIAAGLARYGVTVERLPADPDAELFSAGGV